MSKHTIQELHEKQGLPLSMKIKMTERRIREWINTYGEDGVYISFSGGKDSTVLLDIARKLYPTIRAVFVNTGLEYPEIVKFVKAFDNVEILKPKKNFKQIINEYGYPFFSKEVSDVAYGARIYLNRLRERESSDNKSEYPQKLPYTYYYQRITGTGCYARRTDRQPKSSTNAWNFENRWKSNDGDYP